MKPSFFNYLTFFIFRTFPIIWVFWFYFCIFTRAFKNKKIYVQEAKEKQDDYVGFVVVDGERQIAAVLSVENFGASDILVLDMNGKECRIPFVDEFFEYIDKENKTLGIKKIFYEVVVWKLTF